MLHVAFVGFFLVSGGPMGVEQVCSPALVALGPCPATALWRGAQVIEAAGAATALVGVIVFPLVYALPFCMIVAELSAMMPKNGSKILWTQRAFGNFGGWNNGIVRRRARGRLGCFCPGRVLCGLAL